MNKDTLAIIAAAGLGLYVISKATGIKLWGGAAPTATGANRVAAVNTDLSNGGPNAGMTLADQYKEYAYGRAVANVYDDTGILGIHQ